MRACPVTESSSAGAHPSQPYLHDLVQTVCAPALAISAQDGQLRGCGADGFYLTDRRVLSYLVVTVDDTEPAPIHGRPVSISDARFVGAVRNLGDPSPDPTVFVERNRVVTPDSMQESITISSVASEEVRADVAIEVRSDLLDMSSVRAGRSGMPVPDSEIAVDSVSWRGQDGTHVLVQFNPPAGHVEPSGVLRWSVVLPPRQSHTIVLKVSADHDPGWAVIQPAGEQRAFTAPRVSSGDRRLSELVACGVDDLNGLLAADPLEPADRFLTAGAPWYLTLFGRDSIWAARMLLPLGTELAGGTLRALARRQGRRHDAVTAEEPGKILHELRRSESRHTARSSALVIPPLYYGTVDATPLWITLLHDAWRWGLPAGEVEELLPSLTAALGWLRDSSQSGSGFIRYRDAGGYGLVNQGWKDSHDSVQFRDGRLACPPIALCEVQGYAHLAAQHGAALLDAFGRAGATEWRAWAAALAARFRVAFWVEDPAGAYPAIALDGNGNRVDTVTSNIGHLLHSGLLDQRETGLVVARLASAEMDSGFGLRTMSSAARGFNPLSYHRGSVWAHDTAIAIDGLAASTGEHASRAAASLLTGLLRAGAAFDFRLPELHGGHHARPGERPLPYPAACRPQAWSAAAGIVMLRAILGIDPDVPSGRLRLSPMRPSPVGALEIAGLQVAGEPLGLSLAADGSLDVTHAPAALRLELG